MPATLYTDNSQSSQPTVPLTPLGASLYGSEGSESFASTAYAPPVQSARSGGNWMLTALVAVGGVLAVGSPLALRHRTNAVPAIWIKSD